MSVPTETIPEPKGAHAGLEGVGSMTRCLVPITGNLANLPCQGCVCDQTHANLHRIMSLTLATLLDVALTPRSSKVRLRKSIFVSAILSLCSLSTILLCSQVASQLDSWESPPSRPATATFLYWLCRRAAPTMEAAEKQRGASPPRAHARAIWWWWG